MVRRGAPLGPGEPKFLYRTRPAFPTFVFSVVGLVTALLAGPAEPFTICICGDSNQGLRPRPLEWRRERRTPVTHRGSGRQAV